MENKQRLIDAMDLVIEHLDRKMEESPNRQLADVSNFLEAEKAELEDED